jgi:signal transduction histidine kinase
MTTSPMTTDRHRFRPGFRARVLGFSAGLLVVAMLLGLFIQRAVLLERLDREVADSLDQERRELEALSAGRDPATGAPFDGDVQAIFDTFLSRNVPVRGEVYVTFVGGEPYATTRAPNDVRLDQDPRLVERWASLTTGDRGTLDTNAGPVHYLAVPLRSQGETAGIFVVANFVQSERDRIESALRVEAAVAGVVLIVAIGAAWIIAGRLLRPVRQLTESARSITETDLSRRIPVEGDDEIAVLARTFNEMLDRLDAAFTVQRAFVDDAGHELRTPITIVRGHLELMGDDPHDRAETIALVTDELDRMARIVEDLLLLTKAEHPDFVRTEDIELSDFTTELAVKAAALGERDWRLDACAVGVVRGDAHRLTQAVLNLARNAVEHTGPGAEIGLGSARRGGEVHLWVRDTGPGIDPAERDRIFDRFARGSGPRRSDGAGLGLSIVEAVAVAHHGRVDVDGGVGVGATFTVVIPDATPVDHELGDIARPIEPSDPTQELPVSPEAEADTSEIDITARTP